jgi:ribose transport system permease protein
MSEGLIESVSVSDGSAGPAGPGPEPTAPLQPGTATVARAAAGLPLSGSGGRGRRGFVARRTFERYLLVGVWILLIVFFGVTKSSSFLHFTTVQAIFGNSSIYVFLGLAALCTSVVGEIDLSVAFIMGLSATLVPLLVSEHGVNVIVASVIAIAVGALCGVANAIIIVRLKVNALIATLGLGTVLLGLSESISHQNSVSGLSTTFSKFAVYNILGLPLAFWYGIVLAAVMAYTLSYTPLGRHVAFVGSNREVARLAGIRVNRIRFGAYTSGGLIAGVSGVLLSAQLGGFQSSSAQSYLLPTFAVVFLSAAVIRPGRFNAIGVVVGAYFISTGTLGLELFGYNGPAEQILYGGALVAAVTVVTIVQRQSTSV